MNTKVAFNRMDHQHYMDFVSLMLLRGYDGEFWLESRMPDIEVRGSIETCLQSLLKACETIKLDRSCFQLVAHFPRSNGIGQCRISMLAVYRENNGFLLKECHLIHCQNGGGHFHRHFKRNAEIPAMRELEGLLTPTPSTLARWCRHLLRKRTTWQTKPGASMTGGLCIAVLLLLLSLPGVVQAQISFNLNEWISQKKTEQKYLARHIVELQLYLQLLKEGYKLAKSGLETVRSVKNGEFGLHDLYYLSLKTVSPAIKGMPETSRTLQRSRLIATEVSKLLARIRKDTLLRTQHKQFVIRTSTILLEKVDATMVDLQQVLTNNSLQLTDDQRMERIHQIEQEMEAHYRFTLQLCRQTAHLALMRRGEQMDIGGLQSYYDLK